MSIKEDLVYDKHTGQVIGFVNLGEVNNHLLLFEQLLNDKEDDPVLAKSMMAFMVKGLFTSLRFPYVHFPCTSISGEQIFSPFWQSVFRLEKMGFKVYKFMLLLSFKIYVLYRSWLPLLMELLSTGDL